MYITDIYCLLAATDYLNDQKTIIFDAGSTSESEATIFVVSDTVFEIDETYRLFLRLRGGRDIMLMNDEVEVTILNDDSKSVTYVHVH